MIIEHNVTTGEIVEREMNADEAKQVASTEAKRQAQADLDAQAATDKAALLAKMGLTADEAKLLLS
ncbi:MAG: hypothetical protein RIQ73_482 [Actinomycetota bacterium]|jgi:hypothetical protein